MKDGYLDLDHLKVGCDLDLGFGGDRVELGTKWGHMRMGRGPHRADLVRRPQKWIRRVF
jgi:hypothetical protein